MAAERSGVDAVTGKTFFEHRKCRREIYAPDRLDHDQVADAAEIKIDGWRTAELVKGSLVKGQNVTFIERDPHPELGRCVRAAAKFFKISGVHVS